MRAPWKWMLVATASVLVVVAVLMVGWHGRSAAAREDVAARITALDARRAERNRSREAAWGDTRDGVALAHYATAMQRSAQLPQLVWDHERRLGRPAAIGGRPLTGAALAQFRADWAPVLDDVVAGAHCRDARHGVLQQSPVSLPPAASIEVAARLDEGRELDAVRLWLDVTTFQLDCWPWNLHFDFWDDTRVQRLPTAAAAELDTGLARIEPRLLEPPEPDEVIASYARTLLEGDVAFAEWDFGDVLQSWQSGFDPAAMHLAALGDSLAAIDLLSPPAADRAEREAQWHAFVGRTRLLDSDLARHAEQNAREVEHDVRRHLTDLRALRIGLAAHLGRPLPELVDPWSGAPLRVEREDGAVVVHPAHPQAKPMRWSTHR